MDKIRKINAWISIAVIVILIVATLYCAVTGSQYFFGMLFLMLVVPVVLWVFRWFTHLMYGKSEFISKDILEMAADYTDESEEMD